MYICCFLLPKCAKTRLHAPKMSEIPWGYTSNVVKQGMGQKGRKGKSFEGEGEEELRLRERMGGKEKSERNAKIGQSLKLYIPLIFKRGDAHAEGT